MTEIILIILLLLGFAIVKGIEDAKQKSIRKAKAWKKVRFIQSLAASTRENIYDRNNGQCQSCGARQKLCFFLVTDDETQWNSWAVTLICSNCKGFSRGYSFDRTIPEGTKIVVYERDYGRCKKCSSVNNLCFDHIIPYRLGGASADADNIQLLCYGCNARKQASFRY